MSIQVMETQKRLAYELGAEFESAFAIRGEFLAVPAVPAVVGSPAIPADGPTPAVPAVPASSGLPGRAAAPDAAAIRVLEVAAKDAFYVALALRSRGVAAGPAPAQASWQTPAIRP